MRRHSPTRFRNLNICASPRRCSCCSPRPRAERVKDLATVQGVRNNQLIGYGLVVGLDGTGDQTSQAPFTIQSIKNMLVRFGVTIPAEHQSAAQERGRGDGARRPATLFEARPADRRHRLVDWHRRSLRGGTLIMTPLRGVDGEVYAMAQGNLIVTGFGISGQDGSRIVVNVPSAGRVPNGATVDAKCRGLDSRPLRDPQPARRISRPRRVSPKASTNCSATAPRSPSTAFR